MRLDITPEDAAKVKAVLDAYGDAPDLAGLFDPPERLTAEVRTATVGALVVLRHPTTEGRTDWSPEGADVIARHEGRAEAEADVAARHKPELYRVVTLDPPVTMAPALACPACGSTDFSYWEDYGTSRSMADNADGVLVFYGDFEWHDGDDDPGVICASCYASIDLPEGWEEDYV